MALRQFLIIVTEHRSVIKDWSARGLMNGRPFDSAVLGEGDRVEIADVELSFRVAKSLDLISQLPYVADHGPSVLIRSDADSVVEASGPSQANTEYVTADGMLSFEGNADRLDELISRIESAVTAEMSRPADEEFTDCLAQRDLRASETHPGIDEIPTAATRSDDATMELQADRIDEELRQLEELRAAVQQEREQLLEKRALLAQESLQVESQLKAVRDTGEAAAWRDEHFSSETVSRCDDVVDESASGKNHEGTEVCDEVETDDANFGFGVMSLKSLAAQDETEAVAAEREKLRHLIEEFDSEDEANCKETANVEVAVGAAQTNSEYSVMNALRSRDDAVKQLDELVLAATRGQEPQFPASGETFSGRVADGPSQESSSGSTSLPAGEYSSELHDTAEDHDSSALSNEPASEHETDPNVEAAFAELGALINKIEPATTQSDDDISETSYVEEMSFDETAECHETDVADAVAPDETGLVERQNVESHLDDGEAAWDLTALTQGLDASFAEPHGSAADDEPVPTVQFENEGGSPKFNQQAPEVADTDSEAFESGSAQQDADEDSFTLQSSDIYEIVEEPQSKFDLVESDPTEQSPSTESTAAPLESDALADEVQSEKLDADSNAEVFGEELESDASTQVNAEVPSWFDSKFMAEGDSAVENEPLAQNDDAQLDAAEETVNPDNDEPATDLRQRLAEMFDLPALSESTESIVPDEALESRLRQFRDEPQPEAHADDQADDPSSSWSSAESTDRGSESAATLNFDPISHSETEDISAFESETLNEFPSTVSEENVETDPSPASNTNESFKPEETGEEDDSISAYMERLLARNRQVTGASDREEESASPPPTTKPKPSSNELPTNVEPASESSTAPKEQRENWLEDTPRHRQNRDQIRADVQVLRQIANQSARSAVATASRRDIRKQVIVKTIASMLALASGVAALLLEVSTVFGLTVLCFGLLFSGDLTLTIFRNWKSLRDLKKAAAELNGETSSQGDRIASGNANSTTA